MSRPAERAGAVRMAGVGLLIALLSPFVVLVAIVGLKLGSWNVSVAFDLLTMKVALGLAGLGAIGGASALLAGLTAPRQAGLIGLAAALVAGLTTGAFTLSIMGASAASGQGDVSTDADETPAFSAPILTARETAGADAVSLAASADGCEVGALRRQVAPGVAGYALDKAGFEVRGMGVGRSDGSHTDTWFGFTHDAVVRIRPDRTDVRVTARDRAHDRGEACRLARKIIAGMTA